MRSILNKLKALLVSLLRRRLPSRYPPIIVASMGRSGSTLIYDAICRAMVEQRFKFFTRLGKRVVEETAWDLGRQRLHRGVVYKTHALGNELPEGSGAKVIFLVGSATDAALSVVKCRESKGMAWVEEHFRHLRASGEFSEIGYGDILRFEDQLDSWSSQTDTPIMILKYDAIWDHEQAISDFLGLNIRLPERKARSSAHVDEALRSKVEKTYEALDDRIAKMPGCSVIDR